MVSDLSDANTNSTTLFSDDTDEKARKSANPDACLLTHHEDEVTATQRQIMNQPNAATAASPVEPPIFSLDCWSDVHGSSGRQIGLFASFPKKSELRIGESSAFFSYVKSGMPKSNVQGVGPNIENATQNLSIENKLNAWVGQLSNDVEGCENGDAQEDHLQRDDLPSCSSIHDSVSVERSSTPPGSLDCPQQTNSMLKCSLRCIDIRPMRLIAIFRVSMSLLSPDDWLATY